MNDIRNVLQLKLPEKYVPWKPSPHQAAFLLVPHKEAFYGGAAGGGKSIALLMAALMYVEHPGYNALILRKTFADLNQPEALIDISKEWLSGTDAKWNAGEHKWTFPSGAVLQFGHLEHEDDKLKYQGAAYHFVGFDELTQFHETQYTYLFSRMRRRKTDAHTFPIRMRAAANPGGVGHEWVRDRFIITDDEWLDKTDLAGEPLEREMKKRANRIFIPSGLGDNPFLDQDEYRESLDNLDHVTRAQLLNGDWDIAGQGNMFKREWFDNRIISEVPRDVNLIRRVRYWDLASTDEEKVIKEKGDADYTASVLQALGDDGNVYILEISRDRLTPAAVEKMVKAKAERDGRVGTAIFMEQEPGSSGEATLFTYKKLMLGFNFRGDKPTGNKIERARTASAACENGLVYLVKGAKTNEFVNELVAFPLGAHDDMVDAFSGGLIQISKTANIGQKKKPRISGRRPSIWA
jgi:predicted phage terminase large subunit-like protein